MPSALIDDAPAQAGAGAALSLRLQGTDVHVAIERHRTLLDACLASRVALPYNCRSGECGQCVARLVSGRIHELPGADPATYTQAMREAGLILTCMAHPRSDITLDVPAAAGEQPPIRDFDTVVERVRWFGERTAEVVLRSREPVDFRGGQYFEWQVPGTGRARSYSAANAPSGATLEFLVRMYPGGRISALLRRGEIDAGDVVPLRGPFGSYAYAPDTGGTAIFICGGTGLAPVRSIVASALAGGPLKREIVVLFGARDQAELASADALARAARTHAGLRFVPVLSDEPPASDWAGRRGLVADGLGELLGDQFGAQAYLCGPAPMVDAALPQLERCGLDRADIHCDKFVPAAAEPPAA